MNRRSTSPDTVRRHLAEVLDRVADAGGDPDAVTVVAVTKGFGADVPLAALGAGLVDLGENYAQELEPKAETIAPVVAAGEVPAPRWHFIGRLQSNKVKLLAERVACWQSVDRASLVNELAARAPGARVFIQVNASGENQKGGASPEDAPGLVTRARDEGLAVEGLMTVGVLGDAAATERAFSLTAGLADRLDLPARSMGMSDDLAAAVRAGTTMIRVGTALFGPRPPR